MPETTYPRIAVYCRDEHWAAPGELLVVRQAGGPIEGLVRVVENHTPDGMLVLELGADLPEAATTRIRLLPPTTPHEE